MLTVVITDLTRLTMVDRRVMRGSRMISGKSDWRSESRDGLGLHSICRPGVIWRNGSGEVMGLRQRLRLMLLLLVLILLRLLL